MQYRFCLFSLISALSVNGISYSAAQEQPAPVANRGFAAPVPKASLRHCDDSLPRTGLGSSWINAHLHAGGKERKPEQNLLVSQWLSAEGSRNKRLKVQRMSSRAHKNAGVPVEYLD